MHSIAYRIEQKQQTYNISKMFIIIQSLKRRYPFAQFLVPHFTSCEYIIRFEMLFNHQKIVCDLCVWCMCLFDHKTDICISMLNIQIVAHLINCSISFVPENGHAKSIISNYYILLLLFCLRFNLRSMSAGLIIMNKAYSTIFCLLKEFGLASHTNGFVCILETGVEPTPLYVFGII